MTSVDQTFDLSRTTAEQFERDGFVQLSGVFAPELLAPYATEITRLTIELNTQTAPLASRGTYDRAFLQVMNLWRHSARVSEFVMGKRLARIASQLLGVTGVRLYHDQSLYKEPSGGITPAHADQYYWPFDSDRAVTAWIPLQPVGLAMGPLEFYSGSHRIKMGRDLEISDKSERAIVRDMEDRCVRLHRQPFDLGDVSFHLGWTFHRAGANQTDRPRSVMTIIYIDAQMRLSKQMTDAQRNDWRQWCPDTTPGERIETWLNPQLWPVE